MLFTSCWCPTLSHSSPTSCVSSPLYSQVCQSSIKSHHLKRCPLVELPALSARSREYPRLLLPGRRTKWLSLRRQGEPSMCCGCPSVFSFSLNISMNVITQVFYLIPDMYYVLMDMCSLIDILILSISWWNQFMNDMIWHSDIVLESWLSMLFNYFLWKLILGNTCLYKKSVNFLPVMNMMWRLHYRLHGGPPHFGLNIWG